MDNVTFEYYDDYETYTDSLQRQKMECQSEYAIELRLNSELKIDKERQDIAQRRKIAIDGYYDHYIYPHFEEDDDEKQIKYEEIMNDFKKNLSVSVDEDYENILVNLRDKEFQRLQEEEMREFGHLYRQRTAYDDDMENIAQSLMKQPPPPPPPPAPPSIANGRRRSLQHMNQSKILYQVDSKIKEYEKGIMKELKMKKFEIYIQQKRYQRLQIKRIELECKIQELQTKNEVQNKLDILKELQRSVDKYTEHRTSYLKRVNEEINLLRRVISELVNECASKS